MRVYPQCACTGASRAPLTTALSAAQLSPCLQARSACALACDRTRLPSTRTHRTLHENMRGQHQLAYDADSIPRKMAYLKTHRLSIYGRGTYQCLAFAVASTCQR
eukprot:327310-Pleurochrysis_carterae.AAC.5